MTTLLGPGLPSDAFDLAQTSFGRDAWRRLLRNRAAVASLVFIGILIVLAVFAPLITSRSYSAQDPAHSFRPPGHGSLLGTDALGRDVWSRLVYGARISLTVAFFAEIIQLLIGVPVGLVAGFFGGRVDSWLMRAVDTLFAFPLYLFVIVMATFIKVRASTAGVGGWVTSIDKLTAGLFGVLIALSLVLWLVPARLTRGVVLSVVKQDYVRAARAMGATRRRIIIRHILPNSLAPIIISATFGVPIAILIEAGVSFLGLGVNPPKPSWGLMISDGSKAIVSSPYLVIAPSVALVLTMLAFTYLGDGLRDALDPTTKHT
jgi:oligopeptide transport system permease protein